MTDFFSDYHCNSAKLKIGIPSLFPVKYSDMNSGLNKATGNLLFRL